jgi:protein O-mannosyl-transferase
MINWMRESGPGRAMGDKKSIPGCWQVPASLLLLVVVVYAVVFPGSFFPDDLQIIKVNPLVRHFDLAGIFTTDYWGAGENSGLYRPISILSFALNRMVFGPDAWGYLIVNLLLHATVAYLLFLLLIQFQRSLPVAWLAAVTFAVHPYHGEVVAELVGRSELLAAGFGLITLLLLQARRPDLLPLALVSYLAALLSKEHAVALLAMVPICELYNGRSLRETVGKRWVAWFGLLLITIIWLAWRYWGVHDGVGRVMVLDPYAIPLGWVDAPARVLAALQLQGLYLGRMFVPLGLLGIYPASVVIPIPAWSSAPGLLVAAGSLLFCALLVFGWRQRAFWALALTLYVVNFLPASQLFFATEFVMADRVSYMPSLWFCAGLSSVLLSLPGLCRHKTYVVSVCLILLLSYTATGVARALDFRSPEHLWQSDLRIRPDNEPALLMLGDYYRDQGRLAEAERTLRRLYDLDPRFEQGLSVYAGVLVEQGKPQEAISIARQAIALVKENSLALLPMAAACNLLGKPGEALSALNEVSPSSRQRWPYWAVRGRALELKGDLVGALRAYQKELEIAVGGEKDVYRRLGRLHLQLGDPAMAESALRQDLWHNPESAEGWNLFGVALGEQQRPEEAVLAFRQAVKLKPEVEEYKANLERAVSRR